MPIHAYNLIDIEIVIDGKLLVSKNYESYGSMDIKECTIVSLNECIDERNNLEIENFFNIINAQDVTFKGKGEIDGQGYMWWVREIL